eukprot:scaffold4087_cov96-Isochrysis_galbana.AAC.3
MALRRAACGSSCESQKKSVRGADLPATGPPTTAGGSLAVRTEPPLPMARATGSKEECARAQRPRSGLPCHFGACRPK